MQILTQNHQKMGHSEELSYYWKNQGKILMQIES